MTISEALEGFTIQQAQYALVGFEKLQAEGRLENYCGLCEQGQLLALFDRIRIVVETEVKGE